MRKGFALNWVVSNDGKTTLFGDHDLAALTQAGAQVARVDLRLGAYADWDDAILGRYADVLARLAGAGIGVIGLLGAGIVPGAGQAAWNANDAEHNPAGGDNPFIAAYAQKAAIVASSFPNVTRWELWNEPNAWSSRSGTTYTGSSFIYPSLFATLLRRTYAAIKAVQPAGTVISGGLLGHNNHGQLTRDNSGVTYLQSVYDALGRAGGDGLPFDAVGQHYYLDQGGALDPAHLQGYLDDLRTAVDMHGARPICITEAAWSTTAVSPEVQAANLTSLYAVCAALSDITDLCWFELRDNPPGRQFYGVFAPDWSPKPSLQAYQAI